jgi:quercetin dioxygenase-like cupin family protein
MRSQSHDVSGAEPTRRDFHRAALVSLLAAAAAAPTLTACAAPGRAATQREVIRQELAGERDLILVEVTYPPDASSPPHLHADGVMAFVVAGSVVSKVGDGPERTFKPGDAWWEPPGATHRVSRNADRTQEAKLLAIFVAPRGAAPSDLTRPLDANEGSG